MPLCLNKFEIQVLSGAAVSSEGSPGARRASKLTHVTVGRPQVFAGYLPDIDSLHTDFLVGQLTG